MSTADVVAIVVVLLLVLGVLTVFARSRWGRPTTMQALVGWSIIGAFCALAVAASVIYAALTPSGQPKLRDLQAAPVPAGAAVLGASTQPGNIDSSSQASMEYTLPQQPGAECIDVVQGYLDHHYTIGPENLDTAEPHVAPVTSADSFCARVTFPDQHQAASDSITGVDVIVCNSTGDRSCFEAVLTRPDALHYPEAAVVHATSVLALTAD